MAAQNPIPDEIKLVRNSLGGYSVEWNDRIIDWIHASIGVQWNAYSGGEESPGRPLGRFTKDDAVRRIADASGWTSKNKRRQQ